MKQIFKFYTEKKALFRFMALSYLDKAIIFLLPLLVLFFFENETIYVSIEYIYSITVVTIPLVDFGLSTYFFYAYRNSKNRKSTLKTFIKTYQRIYLLISLLGILAILFNVFIYEYESFVIFIVSRILFVSATTFLASYYRLTNKPEKVIYITIVSNFLSLIFIFYYFFFDYAFSLWLIFAGQILFSVFYFIKSFNNAIIGEAHKIKLYSLKRIIHNSILFSWPTIVQVFLMMYITNYGKINALNNMPIDDGVLLSLIQRFSMAIYLTHSSLLAFFVKSIYIEKNIKAINKKIFFQYLTLLIITLIIVLAISGLYLYNSFGPDQLNRSIIISMLIIVQTFLSCIYAYLELNYGRENKNIIKLYLALFGAVIFVLFLTFLKIDFLEKVAAAMFISTFATLLASIFILYKRNYRVV